jgi:cysteine desulfurase
VRKINFDHIAGSPVLVEVQEAMLPFFQEKFGNPQSIHLFGEESKSAIDEARDKVAALIKADPEEIIFTSSGSESNNLALKGIVNGNKNKGRHIIISAIEHYSISHPSKTLEKEGFEVTQIGVDDKGRVNVEEIKKNIRDDTILVSITAASSEIGTIQPLKEISQIIKPKGIIFHTDAIAAVGSIPVDVNELGIDVLSLSAQSFYAPKGAAALYVRKGIKVLPVIEGGIQERGLRPGTENVPAIIGMGRAAEIAAVKMEEWNKKLIPLRNKLIEELPKNIDNVYVTGDPENRLPGHASFCVEFIEGEGMLLLLSMQGVAVSSGSACTSKALKASQVLLGLWS